MSEQKTLAELANERLIEMAKTLAVKHNLVCENGQIVCWECRDREALIPSLHCPGCLQMKRSARERRLELEQKVTADHYKRVSR